MRLSHATMALLVGLVMLTCQAWADVLVPGRPRPKPPGPPMPPPVTYEQWQAAKAIRDAGHECPTVERLDAATSADEMAIGRKDLVVHRARCSTGAVYLVGLPRPAAGASTPSQPVVRPLP
ncbi:MAG: hypothetical protein KIT36_10585 [Alphaproteobacteria bacterium]|nr:hypothetical protein [Alphaproteobacteria bacterium]